MGRCGGRCGGYCPEQPAAQPAPAPGPMPALRALLNRRKGSPTMSTTPPAPPGVGGGGVGPPSAAALPPPGASPHAAAPPVAPSPRTAAQLARAAFFSTPSPSTKPAPPPVTRRASEEVSLSPTASSPGQPLRRQLSAASLGLGLGGLGLGGLGLSRVKSADGLADVAPLLSRQRSCDSAVGATGAAGRRSPPGRAPGRARAVSCYNVLQFLKDRALPRSSPPPAGQLGPPLRKCLTTGRLQGLAEPVRPVNRLRIPSHGGASAASASRVCSRCSSILSLASSSRYSLHASAASFTPLSPSRTSSPIPGAPPPPEEYVLCKLCLMDVPETLTTRLGTCQCRYCVECMKSYVMFEILEGAYDISCPDAQCALEGVVTMAEIESLVETPMVDKHKRFRLNREVDRDATRTWCPRAGCETVCTMCTPMVGGAMGGGVGGASERAERAERCQPQPVHCPSCDTDFCSACRTEWHPDVISCEENQRRLAARGLLPDPPLLFDSDLIKLCPMCQVPIEKDEGCAQMMCKRCKHVFCWYCLASLDDDFLLRHYDKGPCKNKLGHSRASVIWHRTQVIGIFAGFGILLLVASPLLLLAAPCIVCCKCRACGGAGKLDAEDDLPGDESASHSATAS